MEADRQDHYALRKHSGASKTQESLAVLPPFGFMCDFSPFYSFVEHHCSNKCSPVSYPAPVDPPYLGPRHEGSLSIHVPVLEPQNKIAHYDIVFRATTIAFDSSQIAIEVYFPSIGCQQREIKGPILVTSYASSDPYLGSIARALCYAMLCDLSVS